MVTKAMPLPDSNGPGGPKNRLSAPGAPQQLPSVISWMIPLPSKLPVIAVTAKGEAAPATVRVPDPLRFGSP